MATLARTLTILRDDNLNKKWPNRDRSTDGWIGDAAHQATSSDHNPNIRGIVDAIDVDKDGIHVPTVIASMIRHPSTHYVIHRGRIFSSRDKFKPRVYTGTNNHYEHIHDSIFQSATAENRGTAYKFILTGISTWPVLKKGSTATEYVKDLQAYLNGHGYTLAVDGGFGDATEAAVKSFQGKNGLRADGIVGPATRGKLRPFS